MKHGIKETKDVIKAGMEMSIRMIQIFKDGAQLSDVGSVLALLQEDDEFKAKMMEAYEGYQKIPAELGDLSIFEMVELSKCLYDCIPMLLEALKK